LLFSVDCIVDIPELLEMYKIVDVIFLCEASVSIESMLLDAHMEITCHTIL